MNFFEHQDRAQRNTFRLIGLFAISVVLITVVVNLFAHLLVFGLFHRISDPSFLYPLFLLVTIVTAAFIGVAVALQVQQGRGDAVVSVVALVSILLSLVANWYILQFFQFVSRDASTGAIIRFHVCVSLGTIVCISLVSVYRIYQLRGGGDRIAAELGGVWVDPETTHPLRRRLINVVEEVSLASGVPMPFIYVLERELGINALAVGYSVEDAVVVVSQGALERLNRDELQGMVAHEFTHILNGDMRANIRMMGILFGILGISAIGSLLMQGSLHQNTGSDRKTSGNPIAIAIGMVFWIVGYIGVFSGRLIRAGVSRQREFLADASAVQFTRNPDGLVGALIKISKIKDGSVVHMTRREEVCHMFFAAGQPFWGQFLSTHPPLIDRIRAIKPDFQPDAALAATPSATYVKKVGHAGALAFSTGSQPIPGSVAQNKETVPAIDAFTATLRADRDRPDPQHLSAAIRTLSLMPDTLLNAARRHDEVEALFPALFVSRSTAFRDRRMLHIWDVLGSETGSRVKKLRLWTDRLAPGHTLPLADLAFPALKTLPEAIKTRLVRLMTDLVKMGTKTSLFEYCFVHLLNHRLDDTKKPSHVGGAGKAHPARLREALTTVFSVLAAHGHLSPAKAQQAFEKGIRTVLPKSAPSFIWPKNWPTELDSALDVLNQLNFKSKEKVITALLTTATADGVLCLEEAELLRTICACLGVPVPLMLASSLPDAVHQTT